MKIQKLLKTTVLEGVKQPNDSCRLRQHAAAPPNFARNLQRMADLTVLPQLGGPTNTVMGPGSSSNVSLISAISLSLLKKAPFSMPPVAGALLAPLPVAPILRVRKD
jgi:hypothetical protein